MSDDGTNDNPSAAKPGNDTRISDKILVGVSGCLVGQRVRHDGGHKRNRYVAVELSRVFDYVPFCPEVAAGFGTPRPTLRLVGEPSAPRVIESKTGLDRTDALERAAHELADRAVRAGLSGFVLTAKSPSCGLERVRVYPERAQTERVKTERVQTERLQSVRAQAGRVQTGGSGAPARTGRGLFARALAARMPTLPLEEDGRLNDPGLRENFLLRVFTYRRFHDEVRALPSKGALMRFQAAHKMLLLAHDEQRARALGHRIATSQEPLGELIDHYELELFAALARPTGRRQHQNALHHMAGFLRECLDDTERQELDRVIRSYGDGVVPLAVPISLLRMFNLRNRSGYGAGQVYISPHPDELGLYGAI